MFKKRTSIFSLSNKLGLIENRFKKDVPDKNILFTLTIAHGKRWNDAPQPSNLRHPRAHRKLFATTLTPHSNFSYS
jgi:hypothetical protein